MFFSLYLQFFVTTQFTRFTEQWITYIYIFFVRRFTIFMYIFTIQLNWSNKFVDFHVAHRKLSCTRFLFTPTAFKLPFCINDAFMKGKYIFFVTFAFSNVGEGFFRFLSAACEFRTRGKTNLIFLDKFFSKILKMWRKNWIRIKINENIVWESLMVLR